MQAFDKPIGRVFRRLRVQRFLAATVWSLAVTLAFAAIAIGVAKFTGRALPGPAWAPFAVAGGVALVASIAISILTGPSRVDAAVAIDRAFHLNERLSTALTLPADLRETPAGRALLTDTLKHVADLDLGAKFGLRIPRRSWVPLVPGALAVALMFVPGWLPSSAQGKSTTSDEKLDEKVAKVQADRLKKNLDKRLKAIDKDDKTKFAELEKLLAEIQKSAEQLAKAPPKDKDKALVELNRLQDALKDRQKAIGNAEQISKQLNQLKEMSNNGPADQFAKDMAKGDFEKAAKELKSLQEKLASGKMTEAEKKALQKQLGEMKQQLEKLANMEQRKKQLEDALKKGQMTKSQFDQQMAKLQQQAQDLKKLQKLAKQLGEAQKGMKEGDMKKAAEALGMSKKEIDQMAQQLKELQTLGDAMADLQDAKNGMANNDGTNQLGQQGDDNNQIGLNESMNRGSGNRGRGEGPRAEAPDSTNSYNSRVNQKLNPKGKAIVQGTGPAREQRKGTSTIDITGEFESTADQHGPDALSNQKIPKSVQKHIQGYFDEVRKGR
ncbi:MAG TPA: hypothetical protein VG406_02305 [Isosphaeraceae bacterium]|nr:hypothetical protein [Isosphaeraceae bacterium]